MLWCCFRDADRISFDNHQAGILLMKSYPDLQELTPKALGSDELWVKIVQIFADQFRDKDCSIIAEIVCDIYPKLI